MKHFPSNPLFFTCLQYKTLWENSVTHGVFYPFYPFGDLGAFLIKLKTVVCKLVEVEESKIFRLGKC